MASLTRILSELLNNACKYTPVNEKITITAQPNSIQPIAESILDLPSNFSVPGIQICICNSGIEISKKDLPQLFEPFYRVPNSDFRNQGGTGLGLALVKKLVNYLNGVVQVESALSQTCFKVNLPVTPLSAEPS